MQLVTETRQQFRRDRLLRMPDVEAVTGLRKSTLYKLMREQKFVQCVQISPRCVAWSEAAVLQWVQDRIAAADTSRSEVTL
jgi:prophage regulatory protein